MDMGEVERNRETSEKAIELILVFVLFGRDLLFLVELVISTMDHQSSRLPYGLRLPIER